MSNDNIIQIMLQMCDLWLKTYGLKGRQQVEFMLKYIQDIQKEEVKEKNEQQSK